MDFFGIGLAVKAAASIYFQGARQTGRTTALLGSLKDGDRVVCVDAVQAERLRRQAVERGLTIETVVVSPTTPERLRERGTPPGRLIFDHVWVERYYMAAIERAQRDIDGLQRQYGGHGEAHLETRRMAAELAKWRID